MCRRLEPRSEKVSTHLYRRATISETTLFFGVKIVVQSLCGIRSGDRGRLFEAEEVKLTRLPFASIVSSPSIA